MKVRAATGLIGWWLRRTGYAGITLPPLGIYLLEHRLHDVRLRRHEAAHWRQYQRMGAVRFYLRYLWEMARYGYEKSPMEAEARHAEADPRSGP